MNYTMEIIRDKCQIQNKIEEELKTQRNKLSYKILYLTKLINKMQTARQTVNMIETELLMQSESLAESV